ncbi:Scr1 family TA system antitoxin-like transcriptional regulator [Nocardia colli]|uniref:Scr1 family TA system antitoxin-like transcriptional regulator n=1 Tax=Nocardia colli TaxID=2545717 RepID=UPI0035DAE464
MGATDDWKLLAEHVVARRELLGMGTRQALAEETGLSYRLLGDLERGTRPLSDGTLAILEQALGWAPGSAWQVLRGGTPTIGSSPMPVRVPSVDQHHGALTSTAMQAMSDAYRIAAEMAESGQANQGNRLFEILGDIGQSLTSGPSSAPSNQTEHADSALDARASSTQIVQKSAPTVLRIALGRYMKTLREERQFSCEQVSDCLGCSTADLRCLEFGGAALDRGTIERLLTLYQISDPDVRREFVKLADEADQSGWWTRYNDVLPGWFRNYMSLEQCAATIRTFESGFVPGLLQTADYAHAVIHKIFPDDVEQRVQMRLARQRILDTAKAPILWAIIDETVLRQKTVDADVVRRQIEHLIKMSDRKKVCIQILPRSRSVTEHALSFSLLRFKEREVPDIVYTEQLTNAFYMDRRHEVAPYYGLIERLSVTALRPQESVEFMISLLREYSKADSIKSRDEKGA